MMEKEKLKERLSKLLSLKKRKELLGRFCRYLPQEIGLVFLESSKEFEKLEILLTNDDVKELIKSAFPQFEVITPEQIKGFRVYLAFILALDEYERRLKALEYDGDDLPARLEDERVLQQVEELKLKHRPGRKPKKKLKLEKYWGEIKKLRERGLSYAGIAEFLRRRYRIKVSPRYLQMVYKELEAGGAPAKSER